MHPILRALGITIDFIFFGYIYKKNVSNKINKLEPNEKLLWNLFYGYLVMVIFVTLMPIIISLPNIIMSPYRWMHLNPFEDLRLGRYDALRQVVLNVMMMVPFGFFMGKLFNKNWLRTIFITGLFSFIIEMLQPLLHSYRNSDITDIITNTIGGLLGYLIYHIFFKKKG